MTTQQRGSGDATKEVKDFEVSDEASKRVCSHMNDDHALTVFAMARRKLGPLAPGVKVSDARMKKVTRVGCDIQVITCRQDICQVQKVFWQFDPPLEKSADLRSRLIAVHHEVCAPRTSWLITKPLAVIIIFLVAFLNYCVLALGNAELQSAIYNDSILKAIVSWLFGSPKSFSLVAHAAFYFTYVAHAAEASYAAYHCLRTLKLTWKSTMLWIGLILLTGYPVFIELLPLVKIAQTNKPRQ